MNPRISVALISTGLLLVLLINVPELSAGIAYAAVMVSVSVVESNDRRTPLGTFDSLTAATDVLRNDSVRREAEHGEVAYGDTSDGIVASYADGTKLFYQLHTGKAEAAIEAASTGDEVAHSGPFVELAPTDSGMNSGSSEHSQMLPIHTVACVEPTPLLSLKLKRVDLHRSDSSRHAFWALVFSRTCVPTELLHPGLHPSQIPELIEQLWELHGTWLRHAHKNAE